MAIIYSLKFFYTFALLYYEYYKQYSDMSFIYKSMQAVQNPPSQSKGTFPGFVNANPNPFGLGSLQNQLNQTIRAPPNMLGNPPNSSEKKSVFGGSFGVSNNSMPSFPVNNVFSNNKNSNNLIVGNQSKKQEQLPEQKAVLTSPPSFFNEQRRPETINYDQLIVENTQQKAQIHKLTSELESVRLRQLIYKVEIERLQNQNAAIKKQRQGNFGLSKILSPQNKVAYETLNKKINTYCKSFLELKQLFAGDECSAIQQQIQANISKNIQSSSQDIIKTIVSLIQRISVIEKEQVSEIANLDSTKNQLNSVLEESIKLQSKFDSKLEKKKRMIKSTLQPIEAQIKELEEHIIAIKEYKKKIEISLKDASDAKIEGSSSLGSIEEMQISE